MPETTRGTTVEDEVVEEGDGMPNGREQTKKEPEPPDDGPSQTSLSSFAPEGGDDDA